MTNTTVHGLIVINKPAGVTSYGVVSRVKKLLQVGKAGHTGTLDPFATGVLPVCLNEGTKLTPFIMEGEKEYVGVLHLGVETDTQDISGSITSEHGSLSVREPVLRETFQKFQGRITQIPPMYSALKHKGHPLYYWARQGKEIERNARAVEIREISITQIALPHVFFRVTCSPGTYIRTLASDIGRQLGCGAFLESLERTRSGGLKLCDSISLETVEKTPLTEILTKWIIPPGKALSLFPSVTVSTEIARRVAHGRTVTHGDLLGKATLPPEFRGKVRLLNSQGEVLAMAQIEDSDKGGSSRFLTQPAWKLLRVFNVDEGVKSQLSPPLSFRT